MGIDTASVIIPADGQAAEAGHRVPPDRPGTVARLHLGCGPGPQPAGWVHVDGSWNAWIAKAPRLRRILGRLRLAPLDATQLTWHPDIVVTNLRRSLPFSSNTFEAVYSSHVLEHLYPDEAADLLKECVRVLRPGGALRLVVPDLHSMTVRYLERKQAQPETGDPLPADWLNETLHFRARRRPSGFIFHRIYATMMDLHSHKWMYDAQSLASRMAAAGLSEVQERSLWDSRIANIEVIENPERIVGGAGVCLEGTKSH